MSLTAHDTVRLLEVIFPGLVLLLLVGGVVFRLTVKPTVDAILRLREAARLDQDQAQKTIARLEDEILRLQAGGVPVPAAIGEGAWSTERRR
jgi:hypothetical protein